MSAEIFYICPFCNKKVQEPELEFDIYLSVIDNCFNYAKKRDLRILEHLDKECVQEEK